MFGLDAHEKIPEEFLTNPAAWDVYVGQVWQALFAALDFSADCRVIDIAPGSSAKIGIALSTLGFRGNLYVIDASAEALAALKHKYAEILPDAKIHWLCGELKSEIGKVPSGTDFFVGNHILDDMILAGAKQKDTFSWAAAYTNSPSDAFRKSWEALLENPALLSGAEQAARDEVIAAIRSSSPRNTILSQYPSSTLYDNGMGSLNDHAFAVFRMIGDAFGNDLVPAAKVQAVLNRHKNFGNRHIGENVLNANYWMLCQSKKT